MKKCFLQVIVMTGLVMGMIPAALAQDAEPELIPEITDKIVEHDRTGWHPRLKLNGNFSLSQSENVLGNNDGATVQFGSMLNGTVDYLSKNESHEWTNALLWNLGYSKTPAEGMEDVWVKSMDSLEFKTAYLYHFPKVKWLGPFFQFRLTTAMLPSYEVRGERVRVVRLEADEVVVASDIGVPMDENGAILDVRDYAEGQKFKLTGAFAPLTMRETLGMFVKPFTNPAFLLDARLGVAAWETFVDDDDYFIDDSDESEFYLKLRKLQDSWQVGGEFSVVVSGMLKDNLFSYSASALYMQPFGHKELKYPKSATEDEEEDNLKGIELLNQEYEILLGFNLTSYLSINYQFKALKQPLLIDDWQIQNNLMISVGFDLIGNPPPEAMEAPCDCDEAVNAAKAKWVLENSVAEKSHAASDVKNEETAEPVAPAEAETTAAEAPVDDTATAPAAAADAPSEEAPADATPGAADAEAPAAPAEE